MTDISRTLETPLDPSAMSPEAAEKISAVTSGGYDVRPIDKLGLPKDVPTIKREQYKALSPGAFYIQDTDTEKTVRRKPFEPKSPREWREIPEGAEFTTSDGRRLYKPVYESISEFGTYKYDLATDDEGRRTALMQEFPGGKVETDMGGDLFVEHEGKLYKPRGIKEAPFATMATMAPPVAGSVAGEIGGSMFGSAFIPGPGTLAGGMGGAFLGAAAGQGFNDFLAKRFGVNNRSVWEEAKELGAAGGIGALGTFTGRTGGLLFAGTDVLGSAAISASPKKNTAQLVNFILGTDPTAFRIGLEMAEKYPGIIMPTTRRFPGAARLPLMVEVYNEVLHPSKPLQESARRVFETGGKEILEIMGVTPKGSLVEPRAAPSTKEIGERLIKVATDKMTAADAELEKAFAGKFASIEERTKAIETAREHGRRAASAYLDARFTELSDISDAAVKASGSGRNSGDLWKAYADRFRALKKAFNVDAGNRYGEWTRQYGNISAPVADLGEDAQHFLSILPDQFKKAYPNFIRDLEELAPKYGAHGELIKGLEAMGLGRLHKLRTMVRSEVDWDSLQSDYYNGAAKLFANKISAAMGAADKDAARALRPIDDWYRKEGEIFGDQHINAIIKGLKGGEPADPKVLYGKVVKEGYSDLARKVRSMVGENLWSGVRAADIDDMFQSSLTTAEGKPSMTTIDGSKFIGEIMKRRRAGLLEPVHGEEVTRKLLKQVENLQIYNAELPIELRPGDDIASVLQRIQQEQTRITARAKTDPLALLKEETAKVMAERKEAMAKASVVREKGQLGFLYNPKVGAEEAVNSILEKPDTIYAAAELFKRDSPEFNLLRQIYTQRFLTGARPLKGLGQMLGRTSEDVQNLMWPGVPLTMMNRLADEMALMWGISRNVGMSMSGGELLASPLSGPLGALGKHIPMKLIPGANMAVTTANQAYYGAIASFFSKPSFLRWLEKGLTSSDPAYYKAAQEQIRKEFRRSMALFGATGAGIEESQFQAGEPEPTPPTRH